VISTLVSIFKNLERIETAVARDSRLFARCMSTASICDVAVLMGVLKVHVQYVHDFFATA
jgi:hypothetical protein